MIVPGPLDLTMIRGCTFEALTLTMQDSLGAAVNLTGFSVKAEVRIQPGDPVVIDLVPQITTPASGIVTIPQIDDDTTNSYDAGTYQWDMILKESSDDNGQSVLSGRFYIKNKVTQS